MNLPRWFQQAWPFPGQRKALIAEYSRLKALPLVMADIGLRGRAWSDAGKVTNLWEAGIAEGRRQMALEIFRICRANPEQLFGYVPVKPDDNRS